jgi:hypothetical protein
LYFNVRFFYYRDAHEFGKRFLQYACDIRDNPSVETECQELNPWLDQVALPLVVHALGGVGAMRCPVVIWMECIVAIIV